MNFRFISMFIALFVVIIACKQASLNDDEQIKKELKQLTTLEEKQTFLETILELDQAVRDGEKATSLRLNYGDNSPEFMEYVKTQVEQDNINLKKIEAYLEMYGYPSKEMGQDATTAPWMVIHHSQRYDARVRNFEYVYRAYLNEDIDEGAMSFYLGRMHYMKYDQHMTMESPYMPEDEINALISKLGLEEKVEKVRGEVGRQN